MYKAILYTMPQGSFSYKGIRLKGLITELFLKVLLKETISLMGELKNAIIAIAIDKISKILI
jgi:hypothetical protein